MPCFNFLPGIGPACPAISVRHSRPTALLKCLTRAISHPEQFRYIPEAARAPSLRRGWILEANGGKPNSGFEVLLLAPEEENSSQITPWKGAVEEQEPMPGDNRLRIGRVGNAQTFEDWNKKEGGQPFLEKPKYVRGPDIDKASFIRVYYLSALRVPEEESWELVDELREHLLNWPRVNNIARVPGDDIDESLASLFAQAGERKQSLTRSAVREAVYGNSGQKLTSKTNRIGGKQQKKSSLATKEKAQRSAATTLEVVEEGCESEQYDNFSFPSVQKLGSELEVKWRGPTRLLLLDEKHAGKRASDLPTALQAVHSRFGHLASGRLVTCRLTLYYEYWSMDEVLRELLPTETHVPVEFERTGHIAELQLHPQHLPFRHVIAQVMLDKYQPDIRSVVLKREIMDGKHYTVQLELLAGSSSLVTTAWEHGTPFRVDMASVIWDSRLGADRQRLVGMFSKHDVVCDVYAGVGLIAIPAGKKVRMVFANDANPAAHFYLAKNVVENRVATKVEIFNEDMNTFLSKVFYVERPLPITQLVMSHPSAATDFLEFLVGAFSRTTWPIPSLPRIHLYGISGPMDPEEEFSQRIVDILGSAPRSIHTLRVAKVARKWIIYASFIFPAHVGFESTGNNHETSYWTF